MTSLVFLVALVLALGWSLDAYYLRRLHQAAEFRHQTALTNVARLNQQIAQQLEHGATEYVPRETLEAWFDLTDAMLRDLPAETFFCPQCLKMVTEWRPGAAAHVCPGRQE